MRPREEKLLFTFSGKYGDILWSLPTVKQTVVEFSELVDFAIMPQYESLLDLLQRQPYIDQAFVIPEWITTGSPYGDQPWKAPTEGMTYRGIRHLTYRGHPGHGSQPNMALCDFIAWQQGRRLSANDFPFLFTGYGGVIEARCRHGYNTDHSCDPFITVGFNPEAREIKDALVHELKRALRGKFDVVSVEPPVTWCQAAELIEASKFFVGDRSALAVIAHGLGREVLSYEPNPSRSAGGALGSIFGCPWTSETVLPMDVELAVKYVKQKLGIPIAANFGR